MVVLASSFVAKHDQWITELRKLDDIPWVLVGTMADKREDLHAGLSNANLVKFEDVCILILTHSYTYITDIYGRQKISLPKLGR